MKNTIKGVSKRMEKILLLRRSIKQTNNGYLFTPTAEELETAKGFKNGFKVEFIGGEFPYRIYNT